MMPAQQLSCAISLSELLQGIAQISAADDCQVSGLALDSRDIEPGYVFVACQGDSQHGIEHLPVAIKNGAVAVLNDVHGSEITQTVQSGIPVFDVENLTLKLGEIARRFYADPSRQLDTIAITGTNGKSSCAYYLAQLLSAASPKQGQCGFIGTIGNGLYPDLTSATHTTPDILKVNALLQSFVEQDAKSAVMEVSSHGITQHRVDGVHISVAAFTNLSRDHLDYHGSIENYFSAKAKLFTECDPDVAVINTGNQYGLKLSKMVRELGKAKLITFSKEKHTSAGHIRFKNVSSAQSGISFDVVVNGNSHSVNVPLIGQFNVENVVTVISVLLGLNWKIENIIPLLSELKPAKGRMQTFMTQSGVLVVVDFAHTPDALVKSITSLQEITAGKVVAVFGCGGDRDVGKRPQMGVAAEDHADRIILTNDNPRSEQPLNIIKDILIGIVDQSKVEVILERQAAIAAAISSATSGDTILIAGKGHEEYQIVAGERYAYSDITTVHELLEQ